MTSPEYEKQLQTEHELINRRLTWLLTSQSILFAALAFVLGKDELSKRNELFSKIVLFLGFTISVSILIGIIMGIIAKFILRKDFSNNKDSHNPPLGVRTWITIGALIPDVCIPVAFVIAWVLFYLARWCV